MNKEQLIEKLIDIISNFGDGPLEFETRDIEFLIKENMRLESQIEGERERLIDMLNKYLIEVERHGLQNPFDAPFYSEDFNEKFIDQYLKSKE